VLEKEVNRNFFSYVVNKEKLFVGYKVRLRPKVLFHWDFKDFIPLFEKYIEKCFPEVCRCLQIELFKIQGIELYVSSYNDGEKYVLHEDKGDKKTENKMITFVYYFHSPVKKFKGGELLFPKNGRISIEPVNNTIVFFNPTLSHEVLPVSCAGKKFKNGRFSVNGWILKEPPV
jgi:Rps23 Pro-64 3,4-dihydroxylase Tpa1-like proline 4-hydroxylase